MKRIFTTLGRLVRPVAHWVFLVYTVLIIGTAFVPHDGIDHTALDHLFPIGLGLYGSAKTYPKSKGKQND